MSGGGARALPVPIDELARRFSMPLLRTADLAPMFPDFERLPLAVAQRKKALLLRQQPSDRHAPLLAVISDPCDSDLMVQLEQLAGCPLRYQLASVEDIQAYLHAQEGVARALEVAPSVAPETAPSLHRPDKIQALSLVAVADAASPAVRLVNSTLYDALRAGASDVHLESTDSGLAVRYRIDGVLETAVEAPGAALAEQTISRLKVLAELDIAEHRVPQDGSFRVHAQGREIDLRVSIMPSIHGEDAVVRILDKQAMLHAHGELKLEVLGFDPTALRALRLMIAAPYGMVLVTGPTGSGKTTTLYAALSETHSGQDKIITIEDPVEYRLPGVLQIPVNEKKGLTFARGLRSILRHDPDKIMVGEIRDRETAEIAVQSALTGHLVLTTVHANSVFDVFGRFTHMGLDPYSLVSALRGIWAQRLLRLNCPHCLASVRPSSEELAAHGLSPEKAEAYDFRRGIGCGHCRGTGFKGRRAVAEVLLLDEELRELIVDKQPLRSIRANARAKGARSLLDAAMDAVRTGQTTLEEVRRVTLVE
jgi:general secretion pathway protein E